NTKSTTPREAQEARHLRLTKPAPDVHDAAIKLNRPVGGKKLHFHIEDVNITVHLFVPADEDFCTTVRRVVEECHPRIANAYHCTGRAQVTQKKFNVAALRNEKVPISSFREVENEAMLWVRFFDGPNLLKKPQEASGDDEENKDEDSDDGEADDEAETGHDENDAWLHKLPHSTPKPPKHGKRPTLSQASESRKPTKLVLTTDLTTFKTAFAELEKRSYDNPTLIEPPEYHLAVLSTNWSTDPASFLWDSEKQIDIRPKTPTTDTAKDPRNWDLALLDALRFLSESTENAEPGVVLAVLNVAVVKRLQGAGEEELRPELTAQDVFRVVRMLVKNKGAFDPERVMSLRSFR
ncbi:hypothetical protein BDV96DRAFT_573555, partial [Lophiotrema nucula]